MLLDHSQLENLFIWFSTISLVSSVSVLTSIAIFPTLRKQLFAQLLFFISFCDAIASIFSATGFPAKGSTLCLLQSFFNLVFYKAVWMWTVCLSHHLYRVFMLGKKGLSWVKMHTICWSVSLISTVLPLSTNSYGRDDDGSNGWCFIKTGANIDITLMWIFLTFYSILFISIVLMSVFTAKIYMKYTDATIRKEYPKIYRIVGAMQFYPVGMIVCWGPNFIVSLLLNFNILPHSQSVETAFNAVTLLATQYGTVLAVIFFVSSKDACKLWFNLAMGKPLVVDDGGENIIPIDRVIGDMANGVSGIEGDGGDQQHQQDATSSARETFVDDRLSWPYTVGRADGGYEEDCQHALDMLRFGGRPSVSVNLNQDGSASPRARAGTGAGDGDVDAKSEGEVSPALTPRAGHASMALKAMDNPLHTVILNF